MSEKKIQAKQSTLNKSGVLKDLILSFFKNQIPEEKKNANTMAFGKLLESAFSSVTS